MNPRHFVIPLLLALLAAFPSPVPAGIPSAAYSTVDPVLVWCPAGDDTFHVVTRRTGGNPYGSELLVVEFVNSPAVHLCPLSGDEPYVYDAPSHTVGVQGDPFGLAVLAVRAGGTTPAGSGNVWADGVLMGTRTLVSPDLNGDGVVDGQDVALLQSRMGSSDPIADLDGDGIVGPGDLAVLQRHSGHGCTGATPAATGTWGRLKTMYH